VPILPPSQRALYAASDGSWREQPAPALLHAITTAAAVVARADGRVDPVERRKLGAYLRGCPARGLDAPLARGLFDECVRELERDPASERSALARALAGFAGTPWAWIILRTAEYVAGADGAVQDAEARVIDIIRTALDLPRGVPERYSACVSWPVRT
jgi:tellurite resistance protein